MNANRLKLLMMGLMVLDHISYFVPPEWALIFHVITRCVGVFFGYMAVEGFNYTRNVYRYNGRLYIWAAIMFVGNTLLNHLVNNPAVTVHNNIFFTLALGVSMLIVTKAMLEMPKISLKIVLLINCFRDRDRLNVPFFFQEMVQVGMPEIFFAYIRNLCCHCLLFGFQSQFY